MEIHNQPYHYLSFTVYIHIWMNNSKNMYFVYAITNMILLRAGQNKIILAFWEADFASR